MIVELKEISMVGNVAETTKAIAMFSKSRGKFKVIFGFMPPDSDFYDRLKAWRINNIDTNVEEDDSFVTIIDPLTDSIEVHRDRFKSYYNSRTVMFRSKTVNDALTEEEYEEILSDFEDYNSINEAYTLVRRSPTLSIYIKG